MDPILAFADTAPTYDCYVLTKRNAEEILRARDGRVFVRGQETTDVERIGAAFCEWAKSMGSPSESNEP